MPFDNTIVVVELTREKVEALFKFFLENKRAHPLSKQVQVTIENKKTIKVLIHGKPLKIKPILWLLRIIYKRWRSYEFLCQSKEFI